MCRRSGCACSFSLDIAVVVAVLLDIVVLSAVDVVDIVAKFCLFCCWGCCSS